MTTPSRELFGWVRCTHEGIGLPGCPICDPDPLRVLVRSMMLDNDDLRAALAAAEARVKELEAAERTPAYVADLRRRIDVALDETQRTIKRAASAEAERDAARADAAQAHAREVRALDEAVKLSTELLELACAHPDCPAFDDQPGPCNCVKPVDLDAERARSARLEAALRDVHLHGNFCDGRDVDAHDAKIDAALAASPVEAAKCPHGAHPDCCYDCTHNPSSQRMRERVTVEPDGYAMRVAEAVRTDCHAHWAPRVGQEPEIDGCDLAAIVRGVK